jgi:predicted permease
VVGGRSYLIVGIAPRGFTGAALDPVDIWVPVSSARHPRTDWPTTWNAKWLHTIARLKSSVPVERAAADATAAYRDAYAARVVPAGSAAFASEGDYAVSLRPLRFDATGNEPMVAGVARWVSVVAGVVLLVACANVANLLLARGVGRRREIALRAALGITRGRLLRLLAAELLVLATLSAAGALVVALGTGHWMRTVLLAEIPWDRPPIDMRVLAFTALATLATALLVGLMPMAQAGRVRLTESLREGAPQSGAGRAGLRQLLTIAQGALCVVLLVGAGLFMVSLARVKALDLGIETGRVVAVTVQWRPLAGLGPEQETAERARRRNVREWALPRLQTVRGVESVAASIGLPFESLFGLSVRVPGLEELPTLPGGGPYVSAVDASYFRTVGTSVVAGRGFVDADLVTGADRVAIVSESTARAFWPDGSALGQCISVGDATAMPCSRVVGVAEDTRRFSLQEPAGTQVYVPIGQESGMSGYHLLIRRQPQSDVDADAIRRTLFDADPLVRYVNVTPLQVRIDPQVRPWRLGAATFAGLGGLAFVIAAIGLYGVVAFSTAQRTHEMGVRMALGARATDVVRLVVRQGMTLAATGLALGVGMALTAAPLVEPLLFETSPRSPAVFVAVITILLTSALAATLLPARRASRADPALTLRG